MPPAPKCSTCGDMAFVKLYHYGNGMKSSSRDLADAGPIRWYFHDYGVQLCYCPDCQTAAAKKRRAAEEAA